MTLPFCFSITATVGSNCSSPVSARACSNLVSASCDSATNQCTCNDGFSPINGACVRVCGVGETLDGTECKPGKFFNPRAMLSVIMRE